ncbi:MAG: adenosylcobinamide amidohydrolase [Pseudomonadota bacterium]
MKVTVSPPWLLSEFDRSMRVLSWSLNRPGFVMADRVVWREVRNADLPPDLDAATWFVDELAAHRHADAIGFLTSRKVSSFTQASVRIDDVTAHAVATTGLSNAERVGQRTAGLRIGTINIAASVSTPLADAALIEALSIAVQARTAAVIEHGRDLPEGRATGTGTDCIAVAAPPGAELYAGLHTATGHALGAAVLDAVTKGVQNWMTENAGGN